MTDFFNTLTDFFVNLTAEQQIFLIILSVLVFALGVIVGWILQGTKTRRYKKEMLVLRNDRDLYEQQFRTADAQRKTTAKELEAVSREKVDALDALQGARNEVAQVSAELQPLRARVDELTTSNQSYAATIESLNDQVIGLKTQNEQLMAQGPLVGSGGAGAAGAGGGFEAGTDHQPAVPAAPANDSLNAYIAASEQRFQYLEDRLITLAEENATLRATGAQAPAEPAPLTPDYQPVIPPAVDTDANGEPLVIRADTTDPGARTGGGGQTEVVVQATPSIQVPPITGGATPPDGYDDLTRINNIGPFLQAKLHEQDITRYEQIANWSEADIMTYTELIGYLPGIIQRDDWVGQARALMSGEVADPQPYVAPVEAEASPSAEDDLRVVEGIGPKIESILKASGITTLEQLASTDADSLRRILDEAGSRFRSHNPKTWPAQAGLAADGKLDELRKWQKEMG